MQKSRPPRKASGVILRRFNLAGKALIGSALTCQLFERATGL